MMSPAEAKRSYSLILRAVTTERPSNIFEFEISSSGARVVDARHGTGSDTPIVELPEDVWLALDGKSSIAFIQSFRREGTVHDPGRTFVKSLWCSIGLFDDDTIRVSVDPAIVCAESHHHGVVV